MVVLIAINGSRYDEVVWSSHPSTLYTFLCTPPTLHTW